jgi:hypothetical protein
MTDLRLLAVAGLLAVALSAVLWALLPPDPGTVAGGWGELAAYFRTGSGKADGDLSSASPDRPAGGIIL